MEKKQHDIAEIQKTILASSDSHGQLEQKLRESVEQKEQMSAEYRGFFRKQEEISERCNGLDKEVFRLNNQREKLNESAEHFFIQSVISIDTFHVCLGKFYFLPQILLSS